MERAVQVQLLAFLDENKILSVFQSGFRKKYSTETAVVYGVRGCSLTWFRNYLTTRSPKGQYGKELSSSLPLDFGIRQGSSLLFAIYINDLPQC